MKWTRLQALALKLRAWIRREIYDDDPWDVETLFPESIQKDRSPNASPSKLTEELASEKGLARDLEISSAEQQERSERKSADRTKHAD